LQQNTTVKALKLATIVMNKLQHNVLKAQVATSFSYSGPIEVEDNKMTYLKIKGWNTKAQSRNILSILTFIHLLCLLKIIITYEHTLENPYQERGNSAWK